MRRFQFYGCVKTRDGPQLSDFLRRPKDCKQNKFCFLRSEQIAANTTILLFQGNFANTLIKFPGNIF